MTTLTKTEKEKQHKIHNNKKKTTEKMFQQEEEEVVRALPGNHPKEMLLMAAITGQDKCPQQTNVPSFLVQFWLCSSAFFLSYLVSGLISINLKIIYLMKLVKLLLQIFSKCTILLRIQPIYL